MLHRDENGIAHIVPLSGGKDSTCLALALDELEPWRTYNYIYTPTGNELPEMHEHMDYLQSLLDEPIHQLTNGTLQSQIIANNMIPNVFARWCTRILKLQPATTFYRDNAPVIAYVGLRADEDAREGLRPGGDNVATHNDVTQDYPFQRWGWGLTEVLTYLTEHGISIPARTDCAWCPYQKLGEWYNLWLHHPAVYAEAEATEKRFGHTFRSATRDAWPASLEELRKRFEAGDKPERSLNMMEKRTNMCRACTL